MQDLVNLVDEGRRTRSCARTVLASLILFAATLLCGAMLLRSLTPLYLKHPALRTKFLHFAENADRYDTLFIGSSYVYRGIMPSVFDAVTKASGYPTASFNFGVPGMRGLETEFVLKRVLALEAPNLRWVVIEPNDVSHQAEQVNWKSERFAVWHDPTHTLLALDLLLGGEGPGYEWKSWRREHLPALARHLLGPGRGAAWVETLFEPSAEAPEPLYDGFVALDPLASPRMKQRRASFLERLDLFRERTANLASQTGTPMRDLEPFERRYLARLCASVEDAGARAIFLVPPLPHLRSRYVVRAAADGVVPGAFNYSDPALYGEFYDPALHFDMSHFNPTGARRFTERLAADFVRHAAGKQPREDPSRRVARGPQNWK